MSLQLQRGDSFKVHDVRQGILHERGRVRGHSQDLVTVAVGSSAAPYSPCCNTTSLWTVCSAGAVPSPLFRHAMHTHVCLLLPVDPRPAKSQARSVSRALLGSTSLPLGLRCTAPGPVCCSPPPGRAAVPHICERASAAIGPMARPAQPPAQASWSGAPRRASCPACRVFARVCRVLREQVPIQQRMDKGFKLRELWQGQVHRRDS